MKRERNGRKMCAYNNYLFNFNRPTMNKMDFERKMVEIALANQLNGQFFLNFVFFFLFKRGFFQYILPIFHAASNM